MAGTLWFYVKDDRRLGPVDFEQLVGLLLGAQLPQSALVWHQGLREWQPADRIPEIAEQLPPPLPPGKTTRSTLIIERPLVRPPIAPEPAPAAAPAPRSPRVEDLTKRLEKDPASRLFAQLAEELRKEGDLEEAIRVCRDGLQKHPSYPSARMTLGRALLDSGDLDAAMTEFEAVLQGAPDNLLARRFLEECATRKSEPEVVAAEDAPAAPAAAAAPVAVATLPVPAPVSDGPIGVVSVAMEAPPARGKTAADLPPIPVVAAEEHWELAAPYEVAAPARPAAPPPPPLPAPVEDTDAAALFDMDDEIAPSPAPAAVVAGPKAPEEDEADLSGLLAEVGGAVASLAALAEPETDAPPSADPVVEAAPAVAPEPAEAAAEAPAPAAPVTADEDLPPTGSLAEHDFPDLIHALSVRKWTGTIELHRGRVDTSVQVMDGRLVFASSNNKDERLGELLLRREKITLQQYDEASKAIRKGKRLGTVLVEQNALEAKDLVKVVGDHTREVIYSVFQWTEGFYRLKDGPDPQSESITLRLSSADIIMEGIGRIQAWSRIERGIGGSDAHYTRADDYQDRLREMTLSPEKLLIIGDLGGERDVASICRASKLGDFEVCRSVWAFRVIGILRCVAAPHPAPPP